MRLSSRLLPLLVPFAAFLNAALTASDAVTFTRHPDRIRIEIGGRHFSDYIHAGWPKPSLYPILDADGTSYTRDFPFQKNPAEVPDHDWHRGVWFAHGAVNGHDLWREIPEKKTGRIVLDTIVETCDGSGGVLRLRHRWEAHDAKILLTDETVIRIQRTAAGTILDPDDFVTVGRDEPTGFTWGLGVAGDGLRLYAPDSTLIDTTDWTDGQCPIDSAWSRLPDGTGPFTTNATPSRGEPNF